MTYKKDPFDSFDLFKKQYNPKPHIADAAYCGAALLLHMTLPGELKNVMYDALTGDNLLGKCAKKAKPVLEDIIGAGKSIKEAVDFIRVK